MDNGRCVCKHCGAPLERNRDRDVCPYCGEKNPISEGYETKDFTSLMDPLHNSGPLYKSKRRQVAFFLCLFLGFLGIHDFYLGYKKRAWAILIGSALLIGGVGTLMYVFLVGWWIYLLIFGIEFLFFMIESFRFLSDSEAKDAYGQFLR